jgi:transposase-like protein
MGRRVYTREYKLEAINLVKERGVSLLQAARDLGLHPNTLRSRPRDPSRARPSASAARSDAIDRCSAKSDSSASLRLPNHEATDHQPIQRANDLLSVGPSSWHLVAFLRPSI